MKFSNELSKRIIDIKKYIDTYNKDESMLNIENDSDAVFGLNRKLYVPLIGLILNNNEMTNSFWRLIYEWSSKLNNLRVNLSSSDLITILDTLSSSKKKEDKEVLKRFKTFILTNSIIEKTSDLPREEYYAPGFGVPIPDISNFIEDAKSLLLRLLVHNHGIMEYGVTNSLSYEQIQKLTKYKLLKGFNKKTYEDYSKSHSPYDTGYINFINTEDLKNAISIFPNDYENWDEFIDLMFEQQYPSYGLADLFFQSIVFAKKVFNAREKLFIPRSHLDIAGEKNHFTLEELKLLINSKNIKTIRNEFFKKDNLLRYAANSKDLIVFESGQNWLHNKKRKQPLYEPLEYEIIKPLSIDQIECYKA